jgi:glutathione S-transferase
LAEKTKVNVMLSWYQSYYRLALFGRIRIKIYGTVKKGIPHTEGQLKQADQLMGEALNHLERLLKENSYVAGTPELN